MNESIKVQDLTKGMLSVPKAKKPKTSDPSPSAKKSTVPAKKESKAKKCDNCKKSPKTKEKEEKKTCCKQKKTCCKEQPKKQLKEAETKVTGDDLKLSVKKALAKVMDEDKDKIELIDVPNCIEGSNVYYFKITIQDHKNQTEETSTETSTNK